MSTPRFIDETRILVRSGNGGAGCVSFRREKYVPRGGPDGGDGGDGADVIVEAHRGLATLLDLRYRRKIVADNGRPGEGQDCSGASGTDLIIRVPVGTEIYDDQTDELIVDMVENGQRYVVAPGGKGGRGNARFATASRRTPTYAQPGQEGVERDLRFELKLLADVGLVGFPNAGKSTLISRLSRARPKIADYPFTTLVPNLGVVSVDDERSYVMADIPGLIEGAAEGAGLGIQFLRHIERTRVFVFMVTLDYGIDRSPIEDLQVLRAELERYDPTLLERDWIVALSQVDRPDAAEWFDWLREEVPDEIDVVSISAVSGAGLPDLRASIARRLVDSGRWDD